MSRHSFEPEVAQAVGINAAIVFQNIVFWCEQNAIKGRNIHDGNAWCFNSVTEFSKFFPYLTEKQIRTALNKLEESGLVSVGNYNKDARDRTKWYALSENTKAFALKVNCHLSHLPLRASLTFAPEGKPLPDSKPVDKHTPIVPKGTDLFSKTEETAEQKPSINDDAEFDKFWAVYPKKAGKIEARKAWAKAIKVETPERIIIAAKRYAEKLASIKAGEFKPQTKNAQGWLNGGRWDEFLDGNVEQPAEKVVNLNASPGGEGFQAGSLRQKYAKYRPAGSAEPRLI